MTYCELIQVLIIVYCAAVDRNLPSRVRRAVPLR